jgi:signal transduction histidine kinase/ligand-binding sensor domain-containing protein
MYRKLFRIAFCLLLTSGMLLHDARVKAQAIDVPGYSVTHYSNENGLPQNSVKAIASDEYGFIWLATEAGLCRFDGRHFYLFNKFNARILSSRIVDIMRSPVTHGLHAITEKWTMLAISKGAIDIDNSKWEELYERVNPYSSSATVIQPTWKYSTWKDIYRGDSLQLNLANHLTVLVRYDGLLQWFRQGRMVAKQQVQPIEKFNTIFTIGNVLYQMLPGLENKVVAVLPGSKRAVSFVGDISKVSGTGKYYLCVNHAADQVFLYGNKHFYLITQQPDGNLHTRLLLEGFDFEEEKISSGYYDQTYGRIFLGSHINGLYTFSRKIFTARTGAKTVEADNVVYDLIPYNDSSVLTGKGVVLSANSSRYKAIPNINVSGSVIGNMLYRSIDSTIWTADGNYVYCFSSDALNVMSKWPLSGVTAIMHISSGEIWLGTNKHGVYAVDPAHPEKPARLLFANSDYVGCIQQEQQDVVWVGTENRLMRVRLSSLKPDTIKQLDYKVVRGIYIPRPNEVWLCTYEDGLYLYQDNALTKFPPDRNKSLNTVHHIIEDKKGFFWISTNNGLFQVARTDLLAYKKDHSRMPFYLHYTRPDGFNSNEFNGGGQQVGAKLVNGEFAFPSMDGVVFFKPGEVKTELPEAPVVIDEIMVGRDEMALSDTLQLEHDFASLRLKIATPYFGNADNILLEYRLDGGSWTMLENESLSFNALSASRHLLSIRKRSGFGNSYSYRNIAIVVKPAFYETSAFRVMCLLLIALLIWLFVRLRLSYLNNRNRYLEQTVADRTFDLKEIIHALEISEKKLGDELLFQEQLNKNITHDIRTPLKYLVLFSKHIYNKIEQDEKPTRDEIEGIYVSSERIYSYTDKLTIYLKARMQKGNEKSILNLYEIVAQNNDFFRLALREKNNVIINDLSPGLVIITYPQLFDILMHNLIDNAVKNTQNGIIRISSTEEEGHLVLLIEDNGKGMTEEEMEVYNKYLGSNDKSESEQYTGFGFSMIRDILPLLEIKITVSSNAAGGTVFTLHMMAERR